MNFVVICADIVAPLFNVMKIDSVNYTKQYVTMTGIQIELFLIGVSFNILNIFQKKEFKCNNNIVKGITELYMSENLEIRLQHCN